MPRIRRNNKRVIEKHLLGLCLSYLMPPPVLVRVPFVPLEPSDTSEDPQSLLHKS